VINVVRTERVQRPARGRSNHLLKAWDWLVTRRHRAVAIERLSEHMLQDIGVRRRHLYRRDQHFR